MRLLPSRLSWCYAKGMERKFCWRPDSPSEKDWPASRILKATPPLALPETVRLNYLILTILDQGKLGSCVANALAQAIRASLFRVGVISPALPSRLALYRYARDVLGTPQEDSGSTFRGMLDVCRKLGYGPEAVWPYDDGPDKFKLMPSSAYQRQAHDQVGGLIYYRIDSMGEQRLNDIRTALADKYVVVFGTDVTTDFAGYNPDSQPLPAPRDGDQILGGHGLCLAEYGPGYFGGPNSWGIDYGDRGWFRMSPEYIKADCSRDFWIIGAAVNFSE